MDKLYSKEQIEEWASKRADDAGRLSRQLLDTMRENAKLKAIMAGMFSELMVLSQKGIYPSMWLDSAAEILEHANKDSDIASKTSDKS